MLRSALPALAGVTASLLAQADDGQLWTTANVAFYDAASWRAWVYAEARFSDDDPSFPGFVVAPRVRYEFQPWFSLGVGAARGAASAPASGAGSLAGFWRLEVEQQSRLDLGGGLQFRLRNRWEHQWFDAGRESDRTRHRGELYLPAPGNWRPLHALFVQDEFFHGWTAGTWQENRVVPLGLEWRLGGSSRLRTAYQWQLFNRQPRQQVSHALVLMLDMPLR